MKGSFGTLKIVWEFSNILTPTGGYHRAIPCSRSLLVFHISYLQFIIGLRVSINFVHFRHLGSGQWRSCLLLQGFLYMILKGQHVPGTSTAFGNLDCILESIKAALAGGNFMQHDRGPQINSDSRWAQSRALLNLCALRLTQLLGMCFPAPLTCSEPPPDPFLHAGIPACIFSAQ